MNRLYRIHTEDRENLAMIASQFFPGFTLLKGTGYYDLKAEPSAVIELYGTEIDRPEVEALCRAIAEVNEQQSVMLAEMGGPAGLGITEHSAAPAEPADNVIPFSHFLERRAA